MTVICPLPLPPLLWPCATFCGETIIKQEQHEFLSPPHGHRSRLATPCTLLYKERYSYEKPSSQAVEILGLTSFFFLLSSPIFFFTHVAVFSRPDALFYYCFLPSSSCEAARAPCTSALARPPRAWGPSSWSLVRTKGSDLTAAARSTPTLSPPSAAASAAFSSAIDRWEEEEEEGKKKKEEGVFLHGKRSGFFAFPHRLFFAL